MCYARRDRNFEEVARKRRSEEATPRSGREEESRTGSREARKPLTERVKEMVGAR